MGYQNMDDDNNWSDLTILDDQGQEIGYGDTGTVDEGGGFVYGISQPPVKKRSKAPLILAAAGVILALLVLGYFTVHFWSPAACTAPQQCSLCGKTKGLPLGHQWDPATVSAPMTCRVCGAISGQPLPEPDVQPEPQLPPATDAPTEPAPLPTASEEPELVPASNIVEKAEASSTYPDDPISHSVWNLLDGDLTTNWAENAAGHGLYEYVEFQFDKAYYLSGLVIHGGNQKNKEYYYGNSRPEKILITFSDGSDMRCTLRDIRDVQTISFEELILTDSLRITIESAYAGDQWYDTSISEVGFIAYE